MNKIFKNFIIVFLLFLFGDVHLDALMKRIFTSKEDCSTLDAENRRLIKKLKSKNEEISRFKRDLESEDPSYILLPDLLNLKLDSFSEKFKQFVLSHISFHDFNSKKPGTGLFFFLAGLFSVLENHNDFSVSIKTFDIGESLSSIFYIFKNEELFLKIYLKGLSSDDILNNKLTEFVSSYFRGNEKPSCPSVKILYHSHNIIINYYNKPTQVLNKDYSKILFDNFDNFIDKFKTYCKSDTASESSEIYLNRLWAAYGNNDDNKIEEFKQEKDFHLFLYGIITNVQGLEYLNSNVERGSGRLDIMVKYLKNDNRLIKYVIELKKENSLLDTEILNELKIERAFDQVFQKSYALSTPTTHAADQIIVTVIILNTETRIINFEQRYIYPERVVKRKSTLGNSLDDRQGGLF